MSRYVRTVSLIILLRKKAAANSDIEFAFQKESREDKRYIRLDQCGGSVDEPSMDSGFLILSRHPF